MKKIKRGFALLDAKRMREIASRGGRASQEKGTGHRWTAKEAKAAGKIGGKWSKKKQKFVK